MLFVLLSVFFIFCLPLGVMGWLELLIVALPEPNLSKDLEIVRRSKALHKQPEEKTDKY